MDLTAERRMCPLKGVSISNDDDARSHPREKRKCLPRRALPSFPVARTPTAHAPSLQRKRRGRKGISPLQLEKERSARTMAEESSQQATLRLAATPSQLAEMASDSSSCPHPAGLPHPGVKFPTRVELEPDGSVDIFVDDDEEALLAVGQDGVSLYASRPGAHQREVPFSRLGACVGGLHPNAGLS